MDATNPAVGLGVAPFAGESATLDSIETAPSGVDPAAPDPVGERRGAARRSRPPGPEIRPTAEAAYTLLPKAAP